MIPQFDIFRMAKGEYVWLEATMTVDDAEARVQERGAAEPGEYFIFNQKTRLKRLLWCPASKHMWNIAPCVTALTEEALALLHPR
jgi:hypothetical protein